MSTGLNWFIGFIKLLSLLAIALGGGLAISYIIENKKCSINVDIDPIVIEYVDTTSAYKQGEKNIQPITNRGDK